MIKIILKIIIIGFLVAIFLSLLLPVFFIKTVQANHLPAYQGYVNDFANVLNDDFEHKLESKLKDYDQKTTNQIAVVTIDSTQNETIEDYSIHLADQWKPGVKGKDNGILMLFAMKDHKMRIEVGRGLEGELTDIESKHILDDTIRPLFRANKIEEGVDKGVDAVIVAIATDSAILTAGEDQPFPWSAVLIIGGIILVIVIVTVAASPYTPIGGQGTWGITSGYSSDGDSGFFSSGSGGFGGGSFSGGGASGGW